MNIVEQLKALRDSRETRLVDEKRYPGGAIGYNTQDLLVCTPERLEALTAVIDLFSGESAEADVLDELAGYWKQLHALPSHISAARSGALALRALPKLTQEVERLRGYITDIASLEDYACWCEACAVNEAALRGEGASQ